MNRITHLHKQVRPKEYLIVEDSIKHLDFDKSFFDLETNRFRERLRQKLEHTVSPRIPDLYEKGECMDSLFQCLKDFHLGSRNIKQPLGLGADLRTFVSVLLELGRCDASMATIYFIHIVFGKILGAPLLCLIGLPYYLLLLKLYVLVEMF